MLNHEISEITAERVKDLRRERGMTAHDLGQRCADLGMPHLSAATISNIETGRRDAAGRRRRAVTVDELIVFAIALHVAPVQLLMPTTEDKPYPIMPPSTNRTDLEEWLSGGPRIAAEIIESLGEFLANLSKNRQSQLDLAQYTTDVTGADDGAR